MGIPFVNIWRTTSVARLDAKRRVVVVLLHRDVRLFSGILLGRLLAAYGELCWRPLLQAAKTAFVRPNDLARYNCHL